MQTYRQAAQEPTEDSAGYGEGQGCQGEEGEINGSLIWSGVYTVFAEWVWSVLPLCNIIHECKMHRQQHHHHLHTPSTVYWFPRVFRHVLVPSTDMMERI